MPREDRPRRTPLYQRHREAGGRMVDFAGWELPVQYGGLMEEHRAVRSAAGLFDVSHMGEIRVSGPGAEGFLQRVTPNDVSKLTPGRAHYSGLLTEDGTYVDDLLVYRLSDDEFLLVVNAANVDKDFQWLRSHAEPGRNDFELDDVSAQYALLALQGPQAMEILKSLTETDLEAIRYYRFAVAEVAGRRALISRTGYTGEDGFELYLDPSHAPMLWDRLLAEGKPAGLVPAGLGARDTLRLEAAMALYGHELDETTTPLEAGLQWVVKLGKGDFVGREALADQAEKGASRRLVGFEILDRGIARQGCEVLLDGEPVGEVTSGSWSPTLEKALGMAYVPAEVAVPGREIAVSVRRRELAAVLVDLPFYRRER